MGGSRVILWVAIVLVVTWFLYSVRSILFPFVVGLFVAALLDPSIRGMRKRGFSRQGAVLIIFVGFFALVIGVGILVAPVIGSQVGNIQGSVTNFIKTNLFPPTRLEAFLADRQALEIRDRMEEPERFPTGLPDFQKWLQDSTRNEKEYQPFFDDERYQLIENGLPANRGGLIANLETPITPGPIDQLITRYQGRLKQFNLPTSRSGFEQMFQIRKNVNQLVTGAFGGAARIIQYLGSSLLLLVLTPLITLFILFDYDNFRRRFVTWIPPAIRPGTTELLGDLGDVMASYVRGLTKSVLLFATIMTVVLTVLGVPYSMFLGLLVGVFYLIPYIGNFISVGVIWLAIASSDHTGFLGIDLGSQGTYAAVAVITFLVVAVLYDQLVHPRIVGKAVGLHPVVSFFVILSGGAIFGLAGMILAFPVAGMIKVILDRLIRYTTTASIDDVELPRIPSRHVT